MKKLIVVSAVWCPSCLIIKKHLKKLKNEFPNIQLENIDYDLDEDVVNKYDVKDILPVLIVLEDDNEVGRLVGEKSYDEILSFLKESDMI